MPPSIRGEPGLRQTGQFAFIIIVRIPHHRHGQRSSRPCLHAERNDRVTLCVFLTLQVLQCGDR